MFFTITGLESLTIDWVASVWDMVGRSVATVRAMRAHMLKNGKDLQLPKNEGIRVQMRHQGAYFAVDDSRLHRTKERHMSITTHIDHHGKTNVRSMDRVHSHPRQCHAQHDHLYISYETCSCVAMAAARVQSGLDVDGVRFSSGAEQIVEAGSDEAAVQQNVHEETGEDEEPIETADGGEEKATGEDADEAVDKEKELAVHEYSSDFEHNVHIPPTNPTRTAAMETPIVC
jgi:hypothetical protein